MSVSNHFATEDEKAMAILYQHLLTSWNSRDASGFAQLIAEEGNVIGFDGSQLNGRTTVALSMAEIFSNHPTASYISKIREIRSLADNVYLLRAVVGMVPPGKTDINPAVNAIQSLVAVKKNGKLEIVLFQNTPAQFHGRPAAAEELTNELRAELATRV